MSSEGEITEERWDKVTEKFIKEFSPEIKKFLTTITNLMEWYPKETGKRHLQIVSMFVLFLVGIVGVMGYLTYTGNIGGEAFVFLMGSIVGYVFAFLQRYLGLLR